MTLRRVDFFAVNAACHTFWLLMSDIAGHFHILCILQGFQTIWQTRVLTRTQEVAPRRTWGRSHHFLPQLTSCQAWHPLAAGRCQSWWLQMPSWLQALRYEQILVFIVYPCCFMFVSVLSLSGIVCFEVWGSLSQFIFKNAKTTLAHKSHDPVNIIESQRYNRSYVFYMCERTCDQPHNKQYKLFTVWFALMFYPVWELICCKSNS